LDIFGGVPAPLSSFLLANGEYEKERHEALSAALQLNGESRQLTPPMAACHQASWVKRLQIGFSRVFVPAEMIRLSYWSAIRRFGLVGGYIARCIDLIRRRSRTWKNVTRNDPALKADLANFASREAINAWINTQDLTMEKLKGSQT
jgi:hypothetical protein